MTIGSKKAWTDIRDQIHEWVLDGTYTPGDKLPRDEDIAETLDCSRSTVQRAMGDLSESGIVERRRKGGTTVRSDPVTRATLDIPITRKEVEHTGRKYGYQLVSQTTEMIPASLAARFELPRPCPMLRVQALHMADSEPFIYEDRWICVETVPEIENVDLAQRSANEWLVRNKPYSRCDLRFGALKANANFARLLETELGEALFVMDRTTWIGTAPITSVKAVTTPGYELLTRI